LPGAQHRYRAATAALPPRIRPAAGLDGVAQARAVLQRRRHHHKRFINVHFPVATLRAMVPHVEDIVGCELAPGGALSLALDYGNMRSIIRAPLIRPA
jgi:hypothetical protein